MGKTTKDSNLAVMEPVNPAKPLVKEFVDRDSAIKHFINTRLPHFPHSSVVIKKVYQSADNSILRFRVNYIQQKETNDGLFVETSIVSSRFVEVQCKGTDYKFIDKTGK